MDEVFLKLLMRWVSPHPLILPNALGKNMASCQARWGTPERHGCEGNDTLKRAEKQRAEGQNREKSFIVYQKCYNERFFLFHERIFKDGHTLVCLILRQSQQPNYQR